MEDKEIRNETTKKKRHRIEIVSSVPSGEYRVIVFASTAHREIERVPQGPFAQMIRVMAMEEAKSPGRCVLELAPSRSEQPTRPSRPTRELTDEELGDIAGVVDDYERLCEELTAWKDDPDAPNAIHGIVARWPGLGEYTIGEAPFGSSTIGVGTSFDIDQLFTGADEGLRHGTFERLADRQFTLRHPDANAFPAYLSWYVVRWVKDRGTRGWFGQTSAVQKDRLRVASESLSPLYGWLKQLALDEIRRDERREEEEQQARWAEEDAAEGLDE